MFMQKFAPQTYALLRIMAGFLFLWHGSQKLFDFPSSVSPYRFISWRLPADRVARRSPHSLRVVDTMGGVHFRRRNGLCLLDGAWDSCCAANFESWRTGRALLFSVSFHLGQRCRNLERGQFTEAAAGNCALVRLRTFYRAKKNEADP